MNGSFLLSTAMLHFLAGYMVVVITPVPIALITGSLASLYGFGRMIPLLVGIGVGTAVLATTMALGAGHHAALLPPSMVEIAGAIVFGAMEWRISCMAPPETATRPPKFLANLFAGGIVIGFLSPQTAAFFAVAFTGMMLPVRNVSEALAVAAIIPLVGVGWYALVAAALSRPAVGVAALRRHRSICPGGECGAGAARPRLCLVRPFTDLRVLQMPAEKRFEVISHPRIGGT